MRPLALVSVLTCAALPTADAQPFGPGKLDRFSVEPVLVVYYANELGVTKEQRAYVDQQLEQARRTHQALSAELQTRTAELAATVRQPHPEEAQVLAQLDRVLDVERRIKRNNTQCALRVRERLTTAQIEQLQRLEVPPPPPPPPPPGARPRGTDKP